MPRGKPINTQEIIKKKSLSVLFFQQLHPFQPLQLCTHKKTNKTYYSKPKKIKTLISPLNFSTLHTTESGATVSLELKQDKILSVEGTKRSNMLRQNLGGKGGSRKPLSDGRDCSGSESLSLMAGIAPAPVLAPEGCRSQRRSGGGRGKSHAC
ncbi:hypothetical protein JHK87_006195 [Glycine soja]|nr:hypothetical protein JHK87_006195 [Glycine soja]